MPPTSDGGERTICCSAHKAIPDAEIRADLQVVVARIINVENYWMQISYL